MQSTSMASSNPTVPVMGYPGVEFYVLHIIGLVSLALSLSLSIFTQINLMKKERAVFTRPIGERLVFYLTISDTGYCLSHIIDHTWMLVISYHPPDIPCAIFAFILNLFIFSQSLIVVFTAFNAFMMVVKERKVELGKYDWKLLLYAYGIPFSISLAVAIANHWGPSGAWCYLDKRKPAEKVLSIIVAATFITVFFSNIINYGLVWLKIKRVSASMAVTTSQAKYHRTAKVMMLFVAVYIAQWWAYIGYAIHGFVEPQPVFWVAVVSTFSNLGGLFNFITYTFVKKNQQNVRDSSSDEGQTVERRTKSYRRH